MDSASTASTADMDAIAGENGMDDLIGDSDAASFRYIRLVIYSARAVLCKDYNGFSDPCVPFVKLNSIQGHVNITAVDSNTCGCLGSQVCGSKAC